MFNEKLRVGVIVRPHGLAGEVKVFPTTDEPEKFSSLEKVYIETKTGTLTLKVDKAHYFKQFVIVHFEGLDRIEDIEPFVKKDLWIDRENAVGLEENEYYIADLLGMKVVTDEGEELGRIKDVMDTGANDVYIVETAGGEVLLPAIRQCILKVDVHADLMTVHLMDGLLEVTK